MRPSAAAWHDVEHGAYDADLSLWRDLAEAAEGPILDLGAGTGRVSIDLAARGHEVVALDADPELLDTLAARAPGVTTVTADTRSFHLGRAFALVIAPMQLAQILGGRDSRVAMLACVHAHLNPGGTFAAALAEPRDAASDDEIAPPLPDMLDSDGWVLSSLPVSIEERNGTVVVTRRRLSVSPAGDLDEDTVEIVFDLVTGEEFEDEARGVGLEPVERRTVPETLDHIGSTVIVCRR